MQSYYEMRAALGVPGLMKRVTKYARARLYQPNKETQFVSMGMHHAMMTAFPETYSADLTILEELGLRDLYEEDGADD